jgi:hypothetical protein
MNQIFRCFLKRGQYSVLLYNPQFKHVTRVLTQQGYMSEIIISYISRARYKLGACGEVDN